jgi:hypothetical protein
LQLVLGGVVAHIADIQILTHILFSFSGLQGHDVGGLQALGALLDCELDALPFSEVFSLNGCVVDEHVLRTLARDKAIAPGTVEPFHGSDFTITHVLYFFPFRICSSAFAGSKSPRVLPETKNTRTRESRCMLFIITWFLASS